VRRTLSTASPLPRLRWFQNFPNVRGNNEQPLGSLKQHYAAFITSAACHIVGRAIVLCQANVVLKSVTKFTLPFVGEGNIVAD
jgi:hypothetical protein